MPWSIGEDETRQPVLPKKQAADRYCPPFPPPVIEGVSVTLLIGYSSTLSWTSRAASNLLIAVLAELSRFVLC